jgi:pilus assembly protein Flp/PilA
VRPENIPDERREKSKMILRKFLRDESGATAIEYGLIAACISIASIAAAGAVGTQLDATFDAVATALTPPAPPAN